VGGRRPAARPEGDGLRQVFHGLNPERIMGAAAEAALKAVDVAIQVHGGNAFAAEYGVAGLWWMARVLRTARSAAR
jgi:hypothetical protein